MKRVLLAVAVTVLPAAAQAVPAFLPARDVAITYEVAAPGRTPQDYRLAYDAAARLVRIDSPAGFYMLGNLPAGEAELVLPQLHALVRAPDIAGLMAQIEDADGARFTRLGRAHYAGLACTRYAVHSPRGEGTACLTRDGVALHLAGHDAHGAAEVTALSVSFAPQPPDLFMAPADLTPLSLPPGALAALLNQ